MNPLFTWAMFALCTGVILAAGTKLSIYGDVLASKTGLGRTWIGVVLMASVTSLPELITGISSVTVYHVPDIAAGAILGSCMFNVLILAMLDVRDPVPMSTRIHRGHVLSAAFGIVLMGLVVLSLLAGDRAPTIEWMGVPSIAFLGVYAVAMRAIFVHERARMADIAHEMAEELEPSNMSLRRAGWLYVVNAAFLVAAATYLPGLGQSIAELTGLGQTFVGSLFIALSTSLPEVVVAATAVRIGAVDLAAGNLFGSNLFNIAILGVDDLAFVDGPLLASVSSTHVLSGVVGIAMTGVAIIGMTFRAERKRYAFSWDALGIIGLYAVGVVMLYVAR